MIGVLDYGSGNVNAFLNVYKKLSFDVISVSSIKEMRQCSRLILPGVGAFDWVMKKIIKSGLASHLDDFVLVKQKPILGVCVGMQILFNNSAEENGVKGLGVLEGECLEITSGKITKPHNGWNNIMISKKSVLFDQFDLKSDLYFNHSYYCSPKNKNIVTSFLKDDNEIITSVQNGNIFGVQFHPEKSQQIGNIVINNFLKIK